VDGRRGRHCAGMINRGIALKKVGGRLFNWEINNNGGTTLKINRERDDTS